MRRKLYTQLVSSQHKLAHSRQVASARVRQAASVEDIPALHEAIARGWKLEHQAQTIRQELYYRRRSRPGFFSPPPPVVLDDCHVTLRHNESVRTVQFSSSLPTDFLGGRIGVDSHMGQTLKEGKLMAIVSIPTDIGEKTYQIVAISKIQPTPARSRWKGAKDYNTDTSTI